ncbi:MAG: class I SAM-dependent methyltransferase [Bacillota bacterium]
MTEICVICGGQMIGLPTFEDFPVYLHPVPKTVKEKINSENGRSTCSLQFMICSQCGHARQKNQIESTVLSSIYREYYTYPSVFHSGIGKEQPDHFVEVLFNNERSYLKQPTRVVEVGGYDGYLLDRLNSELREGSEILLIEPSDKGAEIAKAHGINVIREFFMPGLLNDNYADLLISRHLIEHIDHPDDFFSACFQSIIPQGLLVIETPSGDYHLDNGLIEPYHTEHTHVFTEESLKTIMERNGFRVAWANLNPYGNMIVAAYKDAAKAQNRIFHTAINYKIQIEGALSRRANSIKKLHGWIEGIDKNYPIVVWGAGSYGASLYSVFGVDQNRVSFYVDKDRRKWGSEFVSSSHQIMEPQSIMELGIKHVLIASTYSKAIKEELRQLSADIQSFSLWDSLRG